MSKSRLGATWRFLRLGAGEDQEEEGGKRVSKGNEMRLTTNQIQLINKQLFLQLQLIFRHYVI